LLGQLITVKELLLSWGSVVVVVHRCRCWRKGRSAWLKSTPDVSIAGSSEELDLHNALTEELLKAADGYDLGTDCKVKTVSEHKAAPLSNVRKWRLLQKRLTKTASPRNHVRRAAAGVAGYSWLASLVWAAAVATAV
jgi:hypothetical protein